MKITNGFMESVITELNPRGWEVNQVEGGGGASTSGKRGEVAKASVQRDV